jgi:hypothetical protein
MIYPFIRPPCRTPLHTCMQVIAELASQLATRPALAGVGIAAYEEFCVRDSLARLARTPSVLFQSLSRLSTHTYSSAHFFKRPWLPLLLWQDNLCATARCTCHVICFKPCQACQACKPHMQHSRELEHACHFYHHCYCCCCYHIS